MWRKTWRSDGVSGIYRGFGVSVTGIFIYRGLFFGLYDFFKPILAAGQDGASGSGVSAFQVPRQRTVGQNRKNTELIAIQQARE